VVETLSEKVKITVEEDAELTGDVGEVLAYWALKKIGLKCYRPFTDKLLDPSGMKRGYFMPAHDIRFYGLSDRQKAYLQSLRRPSWSFFCTREGEFYLATVKIAEGENQQKTGGQENYASEKALGFKVLKVTVKFEENWKAAVSVEEM
jgi:hypothetical protein